MATDNQTAPGSRQATAVDRAVDRVARSRLASLAAIVVAAFVCFAPGLSSLPPLDGFEPSTMVVAREMVTTGDYAAVRLQTADRTWHARGAYWAEAVAVALAGAGHNPPLWVYRLPSFLAGIATALLTWWLAMAFGRPRSALLAGLLVAGSGGMALMARLASGDMVFVAPMVLAAGALARLWLSDDDAATGPMAALFWTALGAAVLIDGLLAPAIFAATVLILSIERGSSTWLMRLKPRAGIVWLVVLAAPWPIAIAATYLSGAAAAAPSAEALFRLAVPFTVVAPPGTYVIFAGLLAGPALTFVCLGMGWIVDNLRRPPVLFALAWAGPLWLVAELVDAKMPQYVLLAIPAIAVMAAAAIDASGVAASGWIRRMLALAPFASRGLAAIVLPLVFLYWQGWFPTSGFVALVAGTVLAWMSWGWLRAGHAVAAAVLSVVGVSFVFGGFFGGLLPGLDGLRVAERVAVVVRTSVRCADPLLVASGYPEESVVLAFGARAGFADAAGAADFLDEGGCRAAAVEVSQISSFRQRAEDLGVELVDHGNVRGVNLRKMRSADVRILTAASSAR